MPDGNDPTTIKVLGSIADAVPADWDACAGPGQPFLQHGFLSALEDSAAASADQGWQPQHLAIEDAGGRLIAAAPLYLKSHSYGEYVFDWGWAEAYQRAGGRYYPKLLCAVPFTPATGPRLLVRDGAGGHLPGLLAQGMIELAERLKVSSVHVTFPSGGDWRQLTGQGFLPRIGEQFHWLNDGYLTFDDFLGALSSRKRKAIRKERRTVAEAPVTIHTLQGNAITEAHWDAFFDFYMDTADRKWGSPYLNRHFFSLLGERLGEMVVLIMVEAGGRWVAGALNLLGGDTLYGRYWGCDDHFKFLHFETCYYRAIDFAIAHGIKRVEAGAQGPHKLQRGYLPAPTYSAHWIRDPNFRDAVRRFLDEEREQVKADIRALSRQSPFKKDAG